MEIKGDVGVIACSIFSSCSVLAVMGTSGVSNNTFTPDHAKLFQVGPTSTKQQWKVQGTLCMCV